MSIFGTIMSKIFHHDAAAATPAPTGTAAPSSPQPAPGAAPENTGRPPLTQTAQNDNPVSTGSAPATPAPGAATTVDVAAVLNGLAASNSQTLDWKHSIVDMMKLLGLDSSLSSRQELAKELNYTGDMHDSASMNIWLHKQVMQKLAENGGKVPDDLKV